MTKLTNTLYMIVVLLAFGAAQSANAQIHTSSASLAKDPSVQAPAVQVAAPVPSSVAHYGYKSSQDYRQPSQNGAGASYRVISPITKRPQISGASTGSLSGFGTASNVGSRRGNTVSLSSRTLGNVNDDDEFIPGNEEGQGKDPYNNNGEGDPYAGGVTGIPVGSATLPLILLLFAYAAFIAVRKARKEA